MLTFESFAEVYPMEMAWKAFATALAGGVNHDVTSSVERSCVVLRPAMVVGVAVKSPAHVASLPAGVPQ